MHYMGLLDPPNNTAVSVWEDVSTIKLKSWSIVESVDSLKHQVKIMLINVIETINIFMNYSFLSLVIITAAGIYLIKRRKRLLADNIFILLVSSIIMISGYTVLLIEERYIWLCYILIMVIGAKLLDLIFQYYRWNKMIKVGIAFIFMASFLIMPLDWLYHNRHTGEYIYNVKNKLSRLHISRRIASDKEWHNSLYLSFYNDWKYYGEKGMLCDPEFENELKNKMIDYLLIWGPCDKKIKFIEGYEEITDGKIDEMKIYKLR